MNKFDNNKKKEIDEGIGVKDLLKHQRGGL